MFKREIKTDYLVVFFLIGLVLFTIQPSLKPHFVQAVQSTIISVNPYAEQGAIKPEVFGVNHRYHKYGYGSWDTSTQSMFPQFTTIFDDSGFKSMRYPGGTVSNLFRWKDSIGPVSQRKNCIHGGTYEPNATDFGLDEVARYCESHGTTLVYVYGTATEIPKTPPTWSNISTLPTMEPIPTEGLIGL